MKKYLWLLILLLFTSQFSAGGKAEHGSSVWFDGDNDYVETKNNIGISGADSRTLTCWIKIDRHWGATQVFLAWGERIASKVFGMLVNATEDIYFWGYTTGDYDTGIDADMLNSHQYVATYSGTRVKTYYDGLETPISNQAKSLNTTNSPLIIAVSMDSYAAPLAGTIDEVRIYSRVLAPTEIAWCYRYPGAVYNTDGLVLWLKFDEFTGDIAYDSSGGGNDGSLENGPIWTIQTPVKAGKEK